ncbi:pxl-1, partial [Symbiodinium sp. CCMP2592]
IVEELTWARTRPVELIDALRERLKHYKGKDCYPPERAGQCVVTKEGAAVVREAIDYVTSLETLGGVGTASQPGLAMAGEDHVHDIGQTGTASHTSSDGTNAADRARRYGNFELFGECLWYGSDRADARCVVLDLIIDDGVPSRGHRLGVLDPRYDTVGVSYGSHCTFGRLAALEFARGWEPDELAMSDRRKAGPHRISPEVMAAAKAKAETAWSLGSCPVCGEPIKGGKVTELAEMGKLHAACFKCSNAGCGCALAGVPYKVQDKALYCKTCFYEKFGEKCKACGKVIMGTMVSCSLGKLHLECLICSTCQKSIGKASFSTSDGIIRCQACAAAAEAAASAAAAPEKRGKGALASAGSAIAGPKAKAKTKAKAKPAAAKVSMSK